MGAQSTLAQETADSLKSYNLSEIVIGGEARQSERIKRLHKVGLSALALQDRPDIASTLRLLPSASVQTNSRGETLVYIRAAGERQVAVFLDGAPLNIAWDNRVDLSLVPANIVGSITVERGAVSAGYGTNVSGGAINLQTRNLQSSGTLSEVSGQAGSNSSWQTRALFASRSKKSAVLIGSTVAATDGIPVSSDARLPYEESGSVRLNTDRSEGNAYIRVDRNLTNGSWGLTLLHASAEKGVAPEGHLDPAQENVRYWRYPLWRNTMAILNGTTTQGSYSVFATLWASRFQQEIDQFSDDSFASLVEKQRDLDVSAGFRLIGEKTLRSVVVRGISYVSTSRHEQREVEFLSSGTESSPQLEFRNVLYSLGAEFGSIASETGHWAVGATMDGMTTPLTGDKEDTGGFSAASLNLEWVHAVREDVFFKLNGGSKPRFPTMRELFGTALNRFVINPDLKPERTWMAEAGFQYFSERLSFEMIGFLQRTIDTIDQINLIENGSRKRMRVNLDGSRVFGAEVVSRVAPMERLTLDGHVTWMRPVAITPSGQQHLMEKPELLATLVAQFDASHGFRLTTSAVVTGRAYGLAVDNAQVELPTALVLNARVSGRKYFTRSGLFSEAYFGVDNISDTLQLPQLGLPSSGRSFRFGLNISR